VSRRSDLPHVTAILRDAGLVDVSHFTDYHRDRGSALHVATALLDEGDLDPESVDPAIEARLRQYDRWKQETRPDILAIEEPVENTLYRFCGTLDRRIRINGHEGILDIKGPSAAPWQALQVAAYAACFATPMKRWTLHLSDDGYKLIEHADRNDWKVFLAALTVANWKESAGA